MSHLFVGRFIAIALIVIAAVTTGCLGSKVINALEYNPGPDAVNAVVKIGREACEPLLSYAENKENDPTDRAEAVESLAALSCAESEELLIKLLSDKDDLGVNEAAAEALGKHGSNKAVRPLERVIKTHFYPDSPSRFGELRNFAAASLGRIGSAEAISALERTVSNDSSVAASALDGLGVSTPEEAIPFLFGQADAVPEGELTKKVAAVLEDIGPPAERFLAGKLTSNHGDDMVKSVAILTINGEPPFSKVVAAYQSGGWQKRRMAVESFGVMGLPAGRPYVAREFERAVNSGDKQMFPIAEYAADLLFVESYDDSGSYSAELDRAAEKHLKKTRDLEKAKAWYAGSNPGFSSAAESWAEDEYGCVCELEH